MELKSHIESLHHPNLHTEVQVLDDLQGAAEGGQRKIDYCLIDSARFRESPSLRSITATCELKGPARPTLWNPNTKNYYDHNKGGHLHGIKPDVWTQKERTLLSPETEHFVLWISEPPLPPNERDFDGSFGRLIERVEGDVQGVHLEKIHSQNINDGIWLFLLRVHPTFG